MKPSELSDRLVGAIAFPITPFRRSADFAIDEGAFRDHIDFIASSNISAMVVAGGTGEFFALDSEEIVRLGELAVDVVQNRMPIIAGVGRSVTEGRRLAHTLIEIGIDGILVMPPYYAMPDRASLLEYYAGIAAASPESGFVFYARDQVRLEIPMLHSLAEIPNFFDPGMNQEKVSSSCQPSFTRACATPSCWST